MKSYKIIKILNNFYNAVDFSSIRSKELDSVVRSKELSFAVSFIFYILSFIFS